MRRTTPLLAAALLSLLAAGACVSSAAEVQQRPDGISLLVAGGRSGSGMDARMTGTLTVLEGGCVGLDTGGGRHLVAWPPGTDLTTDGDVVVTLNGRELGLGDRVQVDGGSVQVAETPALPDLPASCRAEEIFLVND